MTSALLQDREKVMLHPIVFFFPKSSHNNLNKVLVSAPESPVQPRNNEFEFFPGKVTVFLNYLLAGS